MTTSQICERSLLPVRNGQFKVEVHQAGSGEPLLILHDMTARQPWYPYMDELSTRFRVIAPSLPGFRYSEGLEHIDDPVDMAIFLTDLLDALGIERAVVLGHELGAMFAAELAALSPARVRALVLVAPVGLRGEDADMADIFAMDPADVPQLLWADSQSQIARDWAARPADPDQIEEETVLRARASASASRFLWPFPERGLHKRVHRIKAPTTIVWGEQDRLTPRGLAEAFEKAIPQSRMVTVAGSGHFMLETPSVLLKTLLELAR
jgi:pimeloyl-ACP methyl ester carboxylesterase